MNILVISGRTARQPWTPGGLVARVCAELVRGGHGVTLACQSLEDPAAFSGCSRMVAFTSFDQTATDWPIGFPAWARRQRRVLPHDVSLSFSRVVGGDVWMPIEPSGGAWLARARRSLGLKSLAIAVGRHNGALRAWASDAFLVTPPGKPIRRVIAVGSVAAGEAARSLQRVAGLGERVVRAEPFAMVSPLPPDEVASLRARTRELLGIAGDRRVILVSAPQPVGGLLDPLVRAVGGLAARDAERGPLVLALAKDCFALHARAVRCGAVEHVRIQGLTARVDAALAAADVVALPLRAGHGVFEAGGLCRLGAEALAFGRPVLAVSGASGYGLARLKSSSGDAPGLVIDQPTEHLWAGALRSAMEYTWMVRAQDSARELGREMRFERFAATVGAVLAEAAAERAAEMGRR